MGFWALRSAGLGSAEDVRDEGPDVSGLVGMPQAVCGECHQQNRDAGDCTVVADALEPSYSRFLQRDS